MQNAPTHSKQQRQQQKSTRKRRYLAVLLVLLFLTSCAPISAGKKNRVRGKKVNKAAKALPVGHDLEVGLRKDAKGSPLALLVQKQMDRYDREQVNHVLERGLSGQTLSWTNPDRGNQYRITPLPAYQTIGKSVCRKASIEAMLKGTNQLGVLNTKACRARNNQWRLSEEK
nr:hypothetical protein [Candidatus Electrothrix aestuarii]